MKDAQTQKTVNWINANNISNNNNPLLDNPPIEVPKLKDSVSSPRTLQHKNQGEITNQPTDPVVHG